MKRNLPLTAALVIGIAGAGLALSGCHRKQQGPGQQMKQGVKQVGAGAVNAAKQTGQTLSDAAITTKVKSALAASQGLSSFDIHVETTNGVVKLTGTVDTTAQKTLAGNTASKTDGVKSVDNEITVKGG